MVKNPPPKKLEKVGNKEDRRRDTLHARTFKTPEMDRHIALHALPVIFCNDFFQSQGELVLGEPVGHFDLRGHHGGLKRTQLFSHGPFGPRFGLRTRLRRSVFDIHFTRHPGVELDGERGVALRGFGSRRLLCTRGGLPARFACRLSVFGRDLKVAGLLICGFRYFRTFSGV